MNAKIGKKVQEERKNTCDVQTRAKPSWRLFQTRAFSLQNQEIRVKSIANEREIRQEKKPLGKIELTKKIRLFFHLNKSCLIGSLLTNRVCSFG